MQGTRPTNPNPHEPRYAIEAPAKPEYIAANADASAEWDRVMPLLLEQRVITAAFRAALEGYVLSHADVVVGERLKAQPGFSPFVVEVTVDGAGNEHQKLKPHPVTKLVNDAKRELRAWAGALGLLPSTVGKVASAPPAPAEDEEDAILKRLEQRAGTVVAFNGR
jgi:phage terminase small subunit